MGGIIDDVHKNRENKKKNGKLTVNFIYPKHLLYQRA